MKRPIHPACALYKRLFDEVAADPPPDNPSLYVPRSVFYAQVRKAGIEAPANIVDFMRWEEEVGLPGFVHNLIAAHHRKHGTDFDPVAKASWRFDKRRKRLNLQ